MSPIRLESELRSTGATAHLEPGTAAVARAAGEENLRVAVDSSSDLLCTHALDGRILSVNAACAGALGKSADELRGMTIQNLLSPAFQNHFVDNVNTLLEEGSSAGTMVVTTKNGQERVWEFQNTLMSDGANEPIVSGVAHDVTERENALRSVQRNERQYQMIIENVSDVIAVVLSNGLLGYQTPSVERVLGYALDLLVGTPFADLVHPSDRARCADFFARQGCDPATIQTIELQLHHQSGAWRSFEIVAKNLVNRGEICGTVINARDITERKVLETQLAQANRLTSLGKLAATVAHEFNNVLMGMQPFAELMQRSNATPTTVIKSATHIANSIRRGKRIAADLLRFTQPAQPKLTSVDLGEWWQQFAPEVELVLGNTIRMMSRIRYRGLYVTADKSQLSQVMSNLVNNARDAMPAGGTLSVEAGEPAEDVALTFAVVNPERFIQISVSDTGKGMTPDVMQHIFDPLFTTKQSGNGLGLAVAHQVQTQHGGHIFVESEPGRGTTFHLFLLKGSRPDRQVQEAASDGPVHGHKLLIVEDEETIAEGLTVLMTSYGFEVRAIARGAEATGAIASFRPDFVLLDFGLPDLDGAEVYSRIRKIDPSLPVIFATGHGDRRAIHDNLADSKTRFLQKPFEVATLLETIAELERSGDRQ